MIQCFDVCDYGYIYALAYMEGWSYQDICCRSVIGNGKK